MNVFQSLIISLVEGVTEFLPISSTAHQVLISNILNISQTGFVKNFEIIIQLGAILAVVVLYWRKFLVDFKLMKNLFVALVPALGVGFFFFSFIKNILIGNYTVSLIALIVGGIALIAVEKYFEKRKKETFDTNKLSYKDSFIIGVFQSVSVIPGVSRSAATIVGGMFTGLTRESATEFSFLLAVPTMLAATALDIFKSRSELMGLNFTILAVGFVGAFVFALISIKFLIGYVKKHSFIPFGVYRIVFAILYWVLILK
ncbi:MAG TPA: undecaprenyl-diphosphatase UppP [Candidatus Saccharimonadales bacterium]|nr:undecaprenyl-diphosphatase UppP [Candidatus Saccharimonadales bacterium]